MRELAVIAVAGALGSISRYGVSLWSEKRFGDAFPYGTLLVNVAGSFLLGFVLGMAVAGKLPKLARAGAGAGFLGAFTTFSTFSCETVVLLEEGKVAPAAANVLLNLVLGLIGAWLGFWLATRAVD